MRVLGTSSSDNGSWILQWWTRVSAKGHLQLSSIVWRCEALHVALASFVALAALATSACSQPEERSAPATVSAPAPTDPQHAGITSPHGDHSPHRGGMVLMKGDMHFEVVFDRAGRHQVWFTDAVRSDLPASVATGVTMVIARKGEPLETLALSIDENGESWRASGRPVVSDDVMVTVAYNVEGEPYQIDLPLIIPAKP